MSAHGKIAVVGAGISGLAAAYYLEAEAAKDIAARKVVAVYPMDVAIRDGTVDPLSVRERIRAAHRTTLTKDWYDVPL